MKHLLTLGPLAAAVCLASAPPAFAQEAHRALQPVTQLVAAPVAELQGVVLDDSGAPLAGAVVSALGSATAFAISDGDGRFVFHELPPGSYLVRAHLKGYVKNKHIAQVRADTANVSKISLSRYDQGDAEDLPQVLEAGVGNIAPASTDSESHDHGEVAWRLRHLKRSVLREVESGIGGLDPDGSVFDGVAAFGRTVGESSARVATALASDLPLSGQVNLLTTTAFDRPQDLFTADGLFPRGVAQMALSAPVGGGEWAVRGALTQGDLSSWIVTGSYETLTPATHQLSAGMSYGMQRYLGGNAEALAAVTDGSRNVGSVYAFDDWTISPLLSVGYGAEYARYDYLVAQDLFSPRASVTVRPLRRDSLRVRGLVARREIAPGAEEFLPPATGISLPPERTFSPVSSNGQFVPERIEHVELGAERETVANLLVGVRAFRQQVDDQLVTMFGIDVPGRVPSNIGHYYVASGGDFEARGWGVSVRRDVSEGLRASVDYTRTDTHWVGVSRDASALSVVAASSLRGDRERIHDVTASVESVVPVTNTRLFVVYKVMSVGPLSVDDETFTMRPGFRFEVRANQALPFMSFTNAQWELLVAVRNLFRDELFDSSVYDELLVVNPPTKVVGGLAVRF